MQIHNLFDRSFTPIAATAREADHSSFSTIEAARVASIVDHLEARGQDASQLLAHTGIQRDALSDPHARVSFARYVALLETAAAVLSDDLLGIRLATSRGGCRGGLYASILFNAPTVGVALSDAVRYAAIHNDGASWQISREGLRVVLRYDILDPAASGSFQQIGFALASIIRLIRKATRRPFVPDRLEFAHVAAHDDAAARRMLGTRIRFGNGRSAILLQRSWCDLPIVAADPQLYDILIGYADHVLAQRRNANDVVSQLSQWLMYHLPDGRCDAAAAARAFGVSIRTLSRRLAQRQTTYSRLVEDIRWQLAIRYVADPSLKLAHVAHLVGYGDPTSFSKSFRQRFGCSPRAYRQNNQPAREE